MRPFLEQSHFLSNSSFFASRQSDCEAFSLDIGLRIILTNLRLGLLRIDLDKPIAGVGLEISNSA